jgi:hypothetical protein
MSRCKRDLRQGGARLRRSGLQPDGSRRRDVSRYKRDLRQGGARLRRSGLQPDGSWQRDMSRCKRDLRQGGSRLRRSGLQPDGSRRRGMSRYKRDLRQARDSRLRRSGLQPNGSWQRNGVLCDFTSPAVRPADADSDGPAPDTPASPGWPRQRWPNAERKPGQIGIWRVGRGPHRRTCDRTGACCGRAAGTWSRPSGCCWRRR